MDSPCSCGHFEMRLTSVDLFGAFGQERIDTLMFLTKASEDEIRGVGGGLDPGTVSSVTRQARYGLMNADIIKRGFCQKYREEQEKKGRFFLLPKG